MTKAEKTQAGGEKKARRIPRRYKPQELSVEQWQIALRRQFGRDQDFTWRRLGGRSVFSEYAVTNPETGGAYRVTIRGTRPGDNRCTCPDFTVNTLGTCKHIEFLLSRLETEKKARAALEKGHRPSYSEVYLRYGPKREIVFQPGRNCPKKLLEKARRYFDEEGTLKENGYPFFDRFVREAAAFKHDFRYGDDALAFVAEIRDREYRRQRIDKGFGDGKKNRRLDRLLKTGLYPYQKEGALFTARAGRCLMADDMGLGKTIQAIAAAEILADEFGVERVLIVCPTSLKHQWKQEIEKFSSRSAQVVEGPIIRRRDIFREESFFKIINYDVIHRDHEVVQDWEPDIIILDEAQRIKNWKTRTAKSVKRLRSEFAFVLTGTPLENRLEELHSIIEFVDRFRLGPMFRFLDNHQEVDEAGKVVGYRALDRIGETLKPILVRRTKGEVLDQLPERLDKYFFVEMTPQQMTHHEENQEIVARIVSKWRRYKFLSEVDQRVLTCALQRMRMACDSTYLLDRETNHGVKAGEIVTLFDEIFEDADSKVVVFSQWLRMHDLLIAEVGKKKWKHVMFYGGVPSGKRGELIRRFNEDPECRIFFTTDAGGTGLNLQSANAVINVDMPWNPAVLEQRIGRVHRLGQHQPVRVVNFVAQGTIEHGMLSLLDFKKSMFAGVLDGGAPDVFLGGTRLNRFMETVEKAAGSIPTAMPQKMPDVEMAREAEEPRETEAAASKPLPPARKAPADAFADLLNTGLSVLNALGQAAKAGDGGGRAKAGMASLIHRDEQSGETYLRIPRLEPETADKVTEGLTLIAGALGKLLKSGAADRRE